MQRPCFSHAHVFFSSFFFLFYLTLMPEFVVEVSAHVSLSVSLTTIYNIINSLSKSAHGELHKTAKMKTMAFAYDNFDMDFKG
jgi:hypothetical protein